jgi:hypothetical protein
MTHGTAHGNTTPRRDCPDHVVIFGEAASPHRPGQAAPRIRKNTNATENAALRAPNGRRWKHCSSTERRIFCLLRCT